MSLFALQWLYIPIQKEVRPLEAARVEETKQILIAITELQTNVKNMNTKIDEITNLSKLALQTEQSTKSAHNRIDEIKTDFEKKLREQKEDYDEKLDQQKESFKELKGHITWLWRSLISGFISFIFLVVLFFIERGLS